MLQARVGALIKDMQYTDFPGYWGGLSSQRRGGASGFFGYDSQGSSRILVSVGGVVTDNYSFKAFGEELASGGGTANPYRYVGAFGYYRDTANRYYVRARHLSVPDGRWISRDPIGFDGGDWNLYRYFINRPVMWNDLSGFESKGCTPIGFNNIAYQAVDMLRLE